MAQEGNKCQTLLLDHHFKDLLPTVGDHLLPVGPPPARQLVQEPPHRGLCARHRLQRDRGPVAALRVRVARPGRALQGSVPAVASGPVVDRFGPAEVAAETVSAMVSAARQVTVLRRRAE